MKRLLLSLALLVVAASPALASESSFRTEMIARLEKAYPGVGFKPGAEDLVITAEGGGWDERTINVHRIFLFCQNAPAEDCDTVKQEFAVNIGQQPDAPTPGSLCIIVRDREYVAYLEQMEAESKQRLSVRRPIGEDLFALLASDSKGAIASVGDKALADLGLSEEDAWNRAWRQTVAILPVMPEPAKFREQAMAFEAEEYLASITADLATWQKISDAVGPDLFMTAVSDQFVFAGPMPDGPDLESFRQTVEEDCRAQPRCVSPHIYRFRDGRWVIARQLSASAPRSARQ